MVVVVASATTFVVNQRHDATTKATESETVNVAMTWDFSGGQVFRDDEFVVTARMFNAGPKEIDLRNAYPEGWDGGLSSDRPVTLESGSWAEVPMRLTPDCDEPVPDSIVAEVVTESGESTVTLNWSSDDHSPLPFGTEAFCGTAEEDPQITVFRAEPGESTEDHLPMNLLVGGYGVSEDVQIDIMEVSTDVPGLAIDSNDVPFVITLSEDGSADEPFPVRWRVTDCDAASDFNDITIDVRWEAASGQSGRSDISAGEFPATRAAIALTRFVERQCS